MIGKLFMKSVKYTELTPKEFKERLKAAPIAYLPLGTLEWHGEHLPLGSDGIQSQGFFQILAQDVGGIVLPMLFLGPDRMLKNGDQELYGMDICTNPQDDKCFYQNRQLDGSAYWVSEQLFEMILESVLFQLSRAGFRIIVAHGHGPSTNFFKDHISIWEKKFGLKCFICWGSKYDEEGLGLQVDHAAMNETSLVMALRPELVKMNNLPQDKDTWPIGIAGKDPRTFASKDMGEKIIAHQSERMATILRQALMEVDNESN